MASWAGARPCDVHCAEIGRARIGHVGVERVASVAPLDLGQILKQVPLPAVEELAAAGMAERRRKPEVLGLAAILEALARGAGAIDSDLPARVREDLVDLIEVRVDARPDPVGRQRTAAVMGGIEIDGEVDRCVRGLAELVRQGQRALGVLAALLGCVFVLQIEVHALRTAMLEHHVDRHAGVLDRAQLRLGQGLARMVIAGFADAAAVAAIVVAPDRSDAGGFELRQVGRHVEIGVDDLRAAAANRWPGLDKTCDGISAPAADEATSDFNTCRRDNIPPKISWRR